MEKETPKEIKDRYVLKDVVTQRDTGIGEADSEEVFTDKGLFLEMMNKLDRIEKAIA